jgi:hypothetical protein
MCCDCSAGAAAETIGYEPIDARDIVAIGSPHRPAPRNKVTFATPPIINSLSATANGGVDFDVQQTCGHVDANCAAFRRFRRTVKGRKTL